MKSLKMLSYLGGILSICIGSLLLIKGLKTQEVLWAVVSGMVIICSGIINIISIRLGAFDALRALHLRLLGLFEK